MEEDGAGPPPCRAGPYHVRVPGRLPARPGEHSTTTAEKARIAEIEAGEVPCWYPTTPFGDDREMWRGGHRDHGVSRVCNFWTKRNLWALARLWMEAGNADSRLQPTVKFTITGLMQAASRMNRHEPSFTASILPGTLYVGALIEEASVDRLWRPRISKTIAMCRDIGRLSAAICSTESATQLSGIHASTVDYVFVDPPFGSNIFYADCSLLWESWLGYFTDERFEAVWNRSKKPAQGGKSLDDYERLMTEGFREMYRVLKPGRWASVVFHNSDARVWQAIQRGAVAAGFDLVNALQLDKVQLTFKGLKGKKGQENVTNKDVVLRPVKEA